MYYVKINESYSGLLFKFLNFDDAMNFVGMIAENGTYTDTEGNATRAKATVWFEEA